MWRENCSSSQVSFRNTMWNALRKIDTMASKLRAENKDIQMSSRSNRIDEGKKGPLKRFVAPSNQRDLFCYRHHGFSSNFQFNVSNGITLAKKHFREIVRMIAFSIYSFGLIAGRYNCQAKKLATCSISPKHCTVHGAHNTHLISFHLIVVGCSVPQFVRMYVDFVQCSNSTFCW